MYEKAIYYTEVSQPGIEEIEQLLITYVRRDPDRTSMIKEKSDDHTSCHFIVKFFGSWNLYFEISKHKEVIDKANKITKNKLSQATSKFSDFLVALVVTIEGDEDNDMEYFQDFFYLFEQLVNPETLVYDPVLEQFDE